MGVHRYFEQSQTPIAHQAVSIEGQNHIAYDQPEITITEESMPSFLNEGPNWIDGAMYLSIYAPSQPVVQVIVTDAGEIGSVTDALVLKKDPVKETDKKEEKKAVSA